MKIAMYDLEGNFLKIITGKTYDEVVGNLPKYCKIKDASSIRSCLEGFINSSDVYQFRKIAPNRKPLLRIGDCSRLGNSKEVSVSKYFEGNLICRYKSVSEAALKNKGNISAICQSIKKGSKCGGFEWRED